MRWGAEAAGGHGHGHGRGHGGAPFLGAPSEPGRDRTCDPRIKSPLLYQLSYEPGTKRPATSGATPTGFEPVLPP